MGKPIPFDSRAQPGGPVWTFLRCARLALLLVCPALPAGAAENANALRWGADPSGGAPYVFPNPAHPDEYIGYEKDIADALAKELQLKPEFVAADWETIIPALQRREFDIILNGLEPTPDRAEAILFSRPYYVFRLILTVRRGDPNAPKSLADCRERGLAVGTLANTAASRLLTEEKVTEKSYQDPVGAYADLAAGRVAAVLMDSPAESFYARADPRFAPAAESPGALGVYVLGLRKGDEPRKERIDAALERLLRQGTIENILRKWKLWDENQASLLHDPGGAPAYGLNEVRGDDALDWPAALAKLGRAALVTVGLAFGAMIIAVLLGLPIAWAEGAKRNRFLRGLAVVYVEFFRGTPVVVQLLFLYFGLPRFGIVIPGWLTALIGLGLNYAAYESQVYRAAFGSVARGQWEAATALGFNQRGAFRWVVLPQALRVALPAMTNDFVALFKDTSVAFAISVWELATAYRELANASRGFLGLGLVVCGLYLMMSVPLAHFARRLEKKLSGSVAIEDE